MRNRNIPPAVIKELYARSGNRCSFSGCNVPLFDEANLSEVCHIEGLYAGSARYNASMLDDEANSLDNLILLCPYHHSLVDQQVNSYTVEVLHAMKNSHESHVSQIMDSSKRYEFFHKLQNVFQECNFDRILLQQAFDAPFDEVYLSMVEDGCFRIQNLLNDNCSLDLSEKERRELYYFTQIADSLITGVSMCSYPNGNGFAVPRYNQQSLVATQKAIKSLRSIYVMYRYGSVSR